jgi:hypothetical protein
VPEGQPKSYTGDGVYTPRSVADQSHIPSLYVIERANGADCASLAATEFRSSEVLPEFG